MIEWLVDVGSRIADTTVMNLHLGIWIVTIAASLSFGAATAACGGKDERPASSPADTSSGGMDHSKMDGGMDHSMRDGGAHH